VKITAELSAALAGRYMVEREIGRGGMAVVYLARDTKHDRLVALKVLNPELAASLGADRFLSEIKTTATLQHPNLLPLFDSGEAGGLLYYVMPYLDGESLRARLEREQQLPVEDAVRIAIGIANALSYAHGHGVIHRDLKPENVLLQHGQPVVLDFGIALAVRNAAEGRKTQTGISVGTPQYMSPEQAAGEKVIDGRADIYALGTLLYEMLAGEPPHTGRSAQQIITKVMSGDVRPVTMTRPSVPAHIASAVQRALARVPAERFSTAAEFARALENRPVAEPDAVSGTADAADSVQASSRALEAAGRWRILAIGATAAAVAMLAVTIRAVRQPVPAEPVRRYMLATDLGEGLAGGVIASRIAIARDGSRLVYVGGRRGELLLRNRDELHATPIPGTVGGVAPAFSPNGRQVAFVTLGGALEVVTLDGTPPVSIADSLGGRGGITWMTDETLVADGDGIGELISVDARPGALPRRLTTVDRARGEVDHTAPQGLPGGRSVVFSILYAPGSNRAPSVAVADLTAGTHRVLFDGVNARWSETGHLVYATSDGTLMAVPFDARALTTTGAPVVVARGVRMLGALADVALSSDGTLVYAAGAGATDRELVGVEGDRIMVIDNWTSALGAQKAQAR